MKGMKLGITPLKKPDKYLFKFFFKKPLQNKRFLLGICLKNIGEIPIKKFRIKNCQLGETPDAGLYQECPSEFDVNVLNPGETKTLWIMPIIYPLSGQAWLSINLDNDEIKTYQYDTSSGKYNHPREDGRWRDTIQILDEHTYNQMIMNWILITLTFFMATAPIVNFIKFLIKVL